MMQLKIHSKTHFLKSHSCAAAIVRAITVSSNHYNVTNATKRETRAMHPEHRDHPEITQGLLKRSLKSTVRDHAEHSQRTLISAAEHTHVPSCTIAIST